MPVLGRKTIGSVAYMGGIPAVLESFCWAWGQMCAYNAEVFCESDECIHLMKATVSDHAPARNQLAATFLGDWLIQFDTDHSFDPDIVARLVRTANTYGVDVLSGLYQLKGSPYSPVAWVNDRQPIALLPEPVPTLITINSAGGGCLFVRRSVFDRLAERFPGVGAFDRIGIQSEDHSFFQRCQEASIPCYLAPLIHSAHLRVHPVMMTDLNPEGMLIEQQSVGALG